MAATDQRCAVRDEVGSDSRWGDLHKGRCCRGQAGGTRHGDGEFELIGSIGKSSRWNVDFSECCDDGGIGGDGGGTRRGAVGD